MSRKKGTKKESGREARKKPRPPPLERALSPDTRSSNVRLSMVVALALILRVYALGWGFGSELNGRTFHPDEWAGLKTMLILLHDDRHLETTNYAYTKGAGYFYAGMAALAAAEKTGAVELDEKGMPADVKSLKNAYLSARLVTALFSAGAVLLAGLAGRRLFGTRAGELAALIVCLSPLNVINAHFVKTDCPEAFWVALTMYLAAVAIKRPRMLLAAGAASGVAGAFKYPGITAALMVAAVAFICHREDKKRTILLLSGGAVLSVVFFFLAFPGALGGPAELWEGLTLEFGRKLTAEAVTPAILRPVLYLWHVSQGAGAVMVLWALAAVVYSFIRRKKEAWPLLIWIIPYGLLISSSALVFIRYFVVLVPALSILMARITVESIESSSGAKGKAVKVVTAAACLNLFLICLVHLSAMSGPDPRELAGEWLEKNADRGSVVAVTQSFNGDRFFPAQVDRRRFRLEGLIFRYDSDVSGYLDRGFDFLAVNEKALAPKPFKEHESLEMFRERLKDPGRFRSVASFDNRPAWPLPINADPLAEDLYYLYQKVVIYERVE